MRNLLDRLPRFTLLHGPRVTSQAFATELGNRLSTTHLIPLDFETPVIDAVNAIFFDNDVLSHDFTQPAECLSFLPFSKTITVNDWIVSQKGKLREDFGEDILGKIFLSNYLQNGYESLVPRVIIRDFDHIQDADPIVKYFGRSELCYINLGPLTNNFILPQGRTYWVAVPEASKQVTQFLHDLEAEQPRVR